MCDHQLWDEPDGLPCTRTDRHDRGHTYASRSGSELGEGVNHHEPNGDEQ